TCAPNRAMGQLHDRMPVILAEIDWPKWLGEEPASEQELLSLLTPCPDEALKIWPVDKMVGNVKNNGPQLIMPVMSNAVPEQIAGTVRMETKSHHPACGSRCLLCISRATTRPVTARQTHRRWRRDGARRLL